MQNEKHHPDMKILLENGMPGSMELKDHLRKPEVFEAQSSFPEVYGGIPVSEFDNRESEQEPKSIYLSGAIKGRDLETVKRQFSAIQDSLEWKGFKVINPIEIIEYLNNERELEGEELLTDDNPKHRRMILGYCINVLLGLADELYMIPGWKDSFGATLERDIALKFGIPITYL